MPAAVAFRIAYARYSELRDDVVRQMALGGVLVKVHDAADLTLDTPTQLELVLPDGTSLQGSGKVLQVFSGFGVAVSVEATLVDEARRAANRPDGAGAAGLARHERIPLNVPSWPRATSPAARSPRVTPGPTGLSGLSGTGPRATAPGTRPPLAAGTAHGSRRPEETRQTPIIEGPTRLEKVQIALHGNRDQRNAILRDRDRTLHPFVLKNPQLDADDVLAVARNAQMTADMLSLIADRKEWFQRPAIALALARNPKTPPDLAVRALDHVPTEALRQMAKGAGVLPHVTQAARKKLLG